MNKKVLSAFIACALLLSVASPALQTSAADVSAVSSAAVKVEGDYEYEEIGSGITITKYNGSESVVFIPDKINDMPVYAIGRAAFKNCKEISSVVLPYNLISIEEEAFAGCSELFSVELSDTTSSISERAFANCPQLNDVMIPKNVNFISSDAFDNSPNVTFRGYRPSEAYDYAKYHGIKFNSMNEYEGYVYDMLYDGTYTIIGYEGSSSVIDIPENIYGTKVTSINDRAFKNDLNITDVLIPATITEIPYEAFSGCSNLLNVNLPESVTSISGRAFADCTKLNEVWIPKSVTYISDDAFNNSSHAAIMGYRPSEAYNYAADHNLKFVAMNDYDGYVYDTLYDGTYIILGYQGNSSIIDIPEKIYGTEVTAIGDRAFKNNTNVSDILIPNTIKEIPFEAFAGCSNLGYIVISDSVTSISGRAFADCTKLTEVWIPKSVTHISNDAFENISKFVMHGNRPSEAYNYAAANNIEFIATNNYNGFIYDRLYDETYIILGYQGNDTYLDIPQTINGIGVTAIDQRAFKGHTDIYDVYIPDSITEIPTEAFAGCTEMFHVFVNESVTSISTRAFAGCAMLTDVRMPKETTYISTDAFNDCPNVTFYGYRPSEAYNFAVEHKIPFVSENEYKGLVYDTLYDGTYVILGYEGDDNFVEIPDRIYGTMVTKIAEGAFKKCADINGVSIPDSITEIPTEAFAGCIDLSDMFIPDSVTSISPRAFAGCTMLNYVRMPWENIYISDDAFKDCPNVLFYGYRPSEAYNFAVEHNIPFVSENEYKGLVYDTLNDGTYVIIAYEGTDTVVNVPDNLYGTQVTAIGEQAFKNCKDIVEVTLPNTIKEIPTQAFAGCSNLTKITIPDTVSNICPEAFSGCANLKDITIPKEVVSIGHDAFKDCPDLTIHGCKDSAAEIYAKDNNIPFVDINGGKPDTDTDTDSDSDTDKPVDSDTDSDSDTDKPVDSDTDSDSDTDKPVDSDTDSDSDTDKPVDSDTDSDSDTDTDKKPTPTKTLYHGNIDGDEKVTSKDSLIALRASVGLEKLTKEQEYFADVNGNGKVESNDSLIMLRFSVNLKDDNVTIGYKE